MAPTICRENETRVHGTIRESTKRLQNSTNSSSVISYAGKITHRRSIAVRSATSKLSALRLPDGESSSDDSELDDFSAVNAFSSEEISASSTRDDCMESAVSPADTSDISASCRCSDRLTIKTSTLDSAYDSTRCRYCSSETIATSTNSAIANDIVLFNRERNNFSDETASNYSMYSSWDGDEYSSPHVGMYLGKKSLRNSKGLLDIAVKTVKLIKRNQLLQKKLAQLKFETREFIESVLANPENQNIRAKITTEERQKVEA